MAEKNDPQAAAEKAETRGPDVASRKDNAKLEHSQGGATTRDDALDQGVPMVQGDPSERQGPEDAYGEGAKRGDYSERQDGQEHYESVPVDGGGEPVRDGDGNIVDFAPNSVLAHQNPRTEDVGDAKGLKGGVETATGS